ncbi:MAG: hypothetical protein F6K41_15155 [Symploca sp. SIO3E6]|nr:hypothetical protein [Caldora sp. SIO3E6]
MEQLNGMVPPYLLYLPQRNFNHGCIGTFINLNNVKRIDVYLDKGSKKVNQLNLKLPGNEVVFVGAHSATNVVAELMLLRKKQQELLKGAMSEELDEFLDIKL